MGLLMIADFRMLIVDCVRSAGACRFIGIIVLIALFWGCSGIRLKQPPAPSAERWQQYGGSMERTNVSRGSLTPPLSLAWTYDASAGYSEYSVSIVGDVVFIGTLRGEVFVLDLPTGEKIGKYDFDLPVIGTPLVDSALMIVALANTEESLIGFDLMKGKISWTAKLGGIETAPLLVGDRIVVTTYNGAVYSIDRLTGAVIWKFLTPLFERTAFLRSSPASDGDVLVYGCDDGSLYGISVINGALLWQVRTNQSVTASPSIRNGMVFFGSQDENFYAVDVKTGKTVWRQPLGVKIFASQAVDGEQVYVGTSSGEMVCMAIATGEIVWRYKANSVIASAPFVSGSTIYFGSLDKSIYALDTKTGERLWKYATEARIKSMPVASGNYLVVPLDNRLILAFKPEGSLP